MFFPIEFGRGPKIHIRILKNIDATCRNDAYKTLFRLDYLSLDG